MRNILRLSQFTGLFLAMLLIILGSLVVHADPVGPNNAPTINQRTALPQYGTGDQTNNQGCGPAAAASAIAGATGNGHTDGDKNSQLAKDASDIGALALTHGPNPYSWQGTYDNKLTDAIKEALDSPFYTVERHLYPTGDLILNKLTAGEEIIALLQWDDGSGHFVVIQQGDDTANEDGSNNITVMDPFFGHNLAGTLVWINNASGYGIKMIGEDLFDPDGGWDTPRILSIIEISPVMGDFPTGSTNLGLAQVTDRSANLGLAQVTDGGWYEFVITGTVTADVVINGASVTGTNGTVYLVSGASAYGLSNGTVIVPPSATLTDATLLGFSNFLVIDNSTLFTFVYHYLLPSVSGIVIPIDKFGLLAPYIGLPSTILAAALTTTVYVKRVKRKKEKQ